MKRKVISLVTTIWLLQLIVAPIGQSYVFESVVNQQSQTISPGVLHTVFSYETSSGVKESVQELEVDLLNPYASIEVGLSDPFTKLRRTSKLAELNTYANHHVVGAVNASYFSSKGPIGIVVVDNEIINHGIFGTSTESPTKEPVAFGIGADGKAIIGYYDLNITFTIDGQVYDIHQIDGTRDTNFNVLYTAKKESTGTNIYGSELVVTNVPTDVSKVMLGDQWTGTISEVHAYGTGGNAQIPDDGFVISIHNKELADTLANTLNKEVTVQFSIDQKWQNAKYIIGAGPLLVQDGNVNVSMNSSTSFVKSRQPRTAIMVDETGTKVKLITVDGRQSGFSSGTSLTDLAKLLVSKGAYQALNLDGGGSTTMVARFPGKNFATVVNSPSDGSERAVSAIIQVINSASYGALANFELTVPKAVTEGDTITLKVSNGYDEFYHPYTIDPQTIQWTVEEDIGHITNGEFIATKAGIGAITATVNGISVREEIVVNPFVPVLTLDSLTTVDHLVTSSVRATTNISMSKPGAEASRGTTPAVKVAYEMSTTEAGTSASYVTFKSPLQIMSAPKKLGMWVYGDQKNHWLRSTIRDAAGVQHTINWTAQNGLNWSGWKFVEAAIPSNVSYPINLEKIYLTEPVESMKSNGTIYLSDLKAIYIDDYSEAAFTDVKVDNWASTAISYFANKGYITGYMDGTFKPTNTITRGEAAVIIQRVLGIQATTEANPFTDVKNTSYNYKAILAVNEKGIMTGKADGVFDPNGQLTRAEMAAILVRAFELTGSATIPYPDVKLNDWTTEPISILVANNLVNGFSDGTFRPAAQISRAEFATFIYRVLTK